MTPGRHHSNMFQAATHALQGARDVAAPGRLHAVGENQRLWTKVIGFLCQPTNQLPDALRSSVISAGLSAQQEMTRPFPGFGFLISLNTTVAASLAKPS